MLYNINEEIFYLLLLQVDDGGQMVAIASEPLGACIGAEGRALEAAFLLEKPGAAEHFAAVVGQSAAGLQEVFPHEYLVEEVPLTAIEKGADAAVFQHLPPGIVELARGDRFPLFACSEGEEAFVHGVVVEVTHHHQLHTPMAAQKGVGQLAYLAGSMDAHGRLGSPGRPMVHHEADLLACQLAANNEEAASEVDGVALERFGEHQLRTAWLEKLGVIEQGAIDTSLVGTLEMYLAVGTQLALSH